MSLSDNNAINALITFCNTNTVSVPRDIAALVDNGDCVTALRAILDLDDFDFGDFGNMNSSILTVLRGLSADDVVALFSDGGTWKTGTLRLGELLREVGTTVWGNLRTNEGAVVEMPGGGFIAVSGDYWDVADFYGSEDTTARNGEGYYSIETDGTINQSGWFFAV